jgi:hypothetical protein
MDRAAVASAPPAETPPTGTVVGPSPGWPIAGTVLPGPEASQRSPCATCGFPAGAAAAALSPYQSRPYSHGRATPACGAAAGLTGAAHLCDAGNRFW